MAQVRSRLIFVTLLLFYILLQSDLVRAMFYNVGDDKGWTFGVQDWPNFYKFEAGDILGNYIFSLKHIASVILLLYLTG